MKPFEHGFIEQMHDLNPISAGEGRPDISESTIGARLEYYTLHYILDGSGTFYLPSGTYHVHAGQMVLSCPGEVFSHRPDAKDPYFIRWVGFNGSMANRFMELPRVFDAPDGIMDHLCNLTDHNQNLQVLVASELLQLYGKLFPGDHNNSINSYVYRVISYVQQHYQEPITVQSIADWLGLSRCYLSDMFHKNTNYTLQQYILRIRLTQAEHLLAAGHNVQETAALCGFKNTTSFCKSFKKYHSRGLTPLQHQHRASNLLTNLAVDSTQVK